MPTNTFVTFFDKADGESIQSGKEKWIEVSNWSWEVDAAVNSSASAGAGAGKATPGKVCFTHLFDTASPVILSYISSGRTFPNVELQVTKQDSKGLLLTYFTMSLSNVVVTKVFNGSNPDGTISQNVELVFRAIKIDYKTQDKSGALTSSKGYNWDVANNTVS